MATPPEFGIRSIDFKVLSEKGRFGDKATHAPAKNAALPFIRKCGIFIRKCGTPDLNAKLIEWAPFHFLLMIEWLRDFKASGLDLPPGDQHTTGSFANRAIASQTPEGKVRAWVEANYTHVSDPKDGTKLKLIYEAYRAHNSTQATSTMGRNELAACLKALYPTIKHRCAREGDIYLLRLD